MGISFWLRLYLIIAYFYLYIIHSTSILELSTNLLLKFYKSAFDIDALLSTTILVLYCQFDVSPVNYFDSDQLGHFMLDTVKKCLSLLCMGTFREIGGVQQAVGSPPQLS